MCRGPAHQCVTSQTSSALATRRRALASADEHSKAEDVRNVTITKEATIDAVFDCHSGKIAIERCKNEPVPTLLEVAHQDSSDSDSDSVVDASTVDAFLDMDKRVGSDDSDDGTTDTLWPKTVSDATKRLQQCAIAWNGDEFWRG